MFPEDTPIDALGPGDESELILMTEVVNTVGKLEKRDAGMVKVIISTTVKDRSANQFVNRKLHRCLLTLSKKLALLCEAGLISCVKSHRLFPTSL